MVDPSQVGDEGTLPPAASQLLRLERSVSPDLVSLSSTSGSESPEEEPGVSQHISTSQDDSDVTDGPNIPLNLVDDHFGNATLTQRVLGDGGVEPRSTEEPDSQCSASHCSQLTLSSERDSLSASGSLTASILLVDKEKLAISDYESKGLLYARASKARHNMDLLSPADEVGEEVGSYEAGEDKGNLHVTPMEVRHVKDLIMDHPTLETCERWVAPIDPGALLEIEKSARHVATEMSHVMDNLRNSLYAMTVCTKQSMQLHRESIDNLHTTIDANVKGMYTFMTKFEELHRSLAPMKQLSDQIQEMDENLRVLERTFAKTKEVSTIQRIRKFSWFLKTCPLCGGAANDGQLQFSLSESSLIGSRDEDENMEQDGTSNYGSDAQVTDLEPVEAKISDAGTSDVKMMWKCLEGITDVKKVLRVLIDEVSQQKVTLGQMMRRVTSLEDTSNKQQLLLDHLKSLSCKTKKSNKKTTPKITIRASRNRLPPFKAVKHPTFHRKLTKKSTSRVKKRLGPEVSVCAKSADSSVKDQAPHAILSTDIGQSTSLAVDNMMYKYRKLVLSGKVVALACKLALEVIGMDMLKQCTPRGKFGYSALPVDSLNTIKQILRNYFLWDDPKKFEREWMKCVKGIERLCCSLRKGSKHLLQEASYQESLPSTSTTDESVSTLSTSSNPAEECSNTALEPGNQPPTKSDSAKQTNVCSIPATQAAAVSHLTERPPHLLAPGVAKGPPVKFITTMNTLPSCEIVKSELINLDAFMALHSTAIKEGKCTLSNLTLKLATSVIFGNKVLVKCSPFGQRQGLFGLPVAEFNMLKQLVLDCNPSLWDNMEEFERQWEKECMTRLSRKCSRLRWLNV